jgi:tetratricopeptide (TPR) repeat protein
MLTDPSTRALLITLGLATAAQAQEDPRALMFHARAMQQEGGEGSASAVALYRKVVALEPQSAEAHLRLSESLAEAGDWERALVPALKATELNPKSGEAWFHLAFLHAQRGEKNPAARTDARRAFEEASRLLPKDPEVWYRLALVNQVLGDAEGALIAWIALGRLHPTAWIGDRPLEHIAWENAAVLAGNLDRYELRREAIVALGDQPHPTQKQLRMLEALAREQADKGYLGHAEESFLLLGRHFPMEAAVWENVSHIQMQTGRYDEALLSFQQAEALRPSPRYRYLQGVCLMNLGRLKESEHLWNQLAILEVKGDYNAEMRQNVRFFLATTVLLQGRPSEMLALIQAWPDSTSEADLASLKVGGLIQTKTWKAALASLADGMKRFPEHGLFESARTLPSNLLKGSTITRKETQQALTQLDQESMAVLWAEFHQWERCLEMVLRARAAGPALRLNLLMLQSNALDQLDRPQEAIQVLREAQKLNPTYPMLQNNLGYLILENGGDLQEASQLIQSAMDQDPKNGSTVDSWGWVLFKQGKLKEAEEVLRKAVELTPYSPEIRKHLGEVLLQLDRQQEALEQWERALAYAFPQRKELEAKVLKLRTDLAKKNTPTNPSPDDEVSHGGEENSIDEDLP